MSEMSAGLVIEADRVERAYAVWAPIYDALCGPILRPGLLAAVDAAQESGQKILEIGVGTGLSFSYYRPHIELYGIDVSPAMLRRAEDKRTRLLHTPRIKSLRLMDAHQLEYEDALFDAVVAPFVITLVSDPERVLHEAVRVVRPGGHVFLVNHFYSERGMLALLERKSGVALRKIGLNPDFPYRRIADFAAGDARINKATTNPAGPFFTLVGIEKRA